MEYLIGGVWCPLSSLRICLDEVYPHPAAQNVNQYRKSVPTECAALCP